MTKNRRRERAPAVAHEQGTEDGTEALIHAAHSCAGEDPEEIIACVLKRLGGENAEDVICLTAAKIL
ncbi:hypothetical protein [Nonomuraea sp. CA-141351]|uniref:hypothetical protein n=1 Tax=Nonomuraea sp. CA-141351 TaxID=3239996 RepID=UPI003D92E8E7